MDLLEIDLATTPLNEAGALLLSRLAYPGAPGKASTQYFLGLCNTWLRRTAATDPAWAWGRFLLTPAHALVSIADANRWTKSGSLRLRERLLAGRISLPIMRESILGKPADLRPGITRLSLAQLGDHYRQESAESDAHNFFKRSWRPTLPVLALASALAVHAQWAEAERGRPGRPEEVMMFEDALRFVVETAEAHEPHVAALFDVKPSTMLRIRITK